MHNTELILLIRAEAELSSGLALAARIADRSDFQVGVTVVSDKPAGLIEQVKARLSTLPDSCNKRFTVDSVGSDMDALLVAFESQDALRVLLIPGLDQLDDARKRLLRGVHATVVCFEPHPGLEETPKGLWLIGEDIGGSVVWLCEHMVAHPVLHATTNDDLADAASEESKSQHAASDLVFICTSVQEIDAAAKSTRIAIKAAVGPVLLVRGEGTWLEWFINRKLVGFAKRYIPQMERSKRRELSENLRQYSKLDFEFVALICSATFLAAFGLVQNSAAVIIGAMLIAPLMTPMLGAGLSLAHGNRPLFAESLKTILIGFLAALATSCCFGLLVRFLAPSILEHDASGRVLLTSEMWSRTHPTSIDFLVGLVGGSAAAFARTRTHLADALAGAAIAAALVPPIATAGLQLSLISVDIAPAAGTTELTNLIYGPILLFAANMLTIMIGSSFVLWACGVRAEHRYSTRDRWSTRTTVLLLTLTAAIAVWIVQTM